MFRGFRCAMSSSSGPSTGSFTDIALSDQHGSQGSRGSSDGSCSGSHICDCSGPCACAGGSQGSSGTSPPACDDGSAWRNVCSAADLLIRGVAGFAQCDVGSSEQCPSADAMPLCISQRTAPGNTNLASGSSTAMESYPIGPGAPGGGSNSESRSGVIRGATMIGTQNDPRAVGSAAAPALLDPASPVMDCPQAPVPAFRPKTPEALMQRDPASPAHPISSGCGKTGCPGFTRMPISSVPATSAPTQIGSYCREGVRSATDVLHTAFPD